MSTPETQPPKDPALQSALTTLIQPQTKFPIGVHVGRYLSSFGALMLPLCLGGTAGFYLADRGTRWMPTMLHVIFACLIGAVILMLLGRWMAGRAVAETAKGLRVRTRVFVLLLIALAACAVEYVTFVATQECPLTSLSDEDLEVAINDDLRKYRDLREGMENTLARVEAEGFLNEPSEDPLTRSQERFLRSAWVSFRNQAIALDQMRVFYEDYWRFDASRVERSKHVRAFLLTFASELCVYETSARFTRLAFNNPNAVKFLNTPSELHDLPENSLSLLRQEILGTRDESRVLAGTQYLKWLDTGLLARNDLRAMNLLWLWDAVEEHIQSTREFSAFSRGAQTLRADSQGIKRNVRRVWFPAQKNIAKWTGDTRTRRIGRYFVDRTLQEEIDPHLEPGDILISRKNWYLSNIGLPGFWPHALLYLGDPDKFSRAFNTPEIRAWTRAETGRELSLAEYLKIRWPSRWRRYVLGQHKDTNRVLEAISEGIVFNTMNHAAGDYLAALRPRLTQLDKAKAIYDAFSHVGKPYDFDFDFATDHTLVCTELVWRSYLPDPERNKAGLNIPLLDVAGRKTLPANELVRLFAEEEGKPNAQLEFVYFLDASEEEQRAFVSNLDAFRNSWKRPQLDRKQH